MEVLDPDVDWKGWKGRWIRTWLMEGLDLDVDWKGWKGRRIGRDVDWIKTMLMEGLDPDVVDGRVGSGRRR